MNQKEYQLIANVLTQFKHEYFYETIIDAFSEMLEGEYDNFDPDKFLKSCGL